MSETLKRLKDHYVPRIHPDREGFEILDWEDRESQYSRFDVLLDSVSLQGKSLLDVGCGVGDLCVYIKEKGFSVDYRGVDILGDMVTEARRRCGSDCFFQADILEIDPFDGKKFDVAFCSGIFNLETGNNKQLFDRFLPRLKEMTGEAVVINLLSVKSPDITRGYHYFDPAAVRGQALQLYSEVEVKEGYLNNDFTLVCRH